MALDIEKDLSRGRSRLRTWHPYWAEQQAFFEGRHFVFRSRRDGRLNELRTEIDPLDPYTARTRRNRTFKIVNTAVSLGTQRTPGYEVVPSTTDPEDIAAASLSEKLLLHWWEYLNLRADISMVFRYAVINGEGFYRPYWNNGVGDVLPPRTEGPAGLLQRVLNGPEPELRTGELAGDVLGPESVFWEPGMPFDRSEWHAIEQALMPEKARELPNFKQGSELKPDSVAHGSFVQGALARANAKADTVMVTEYLRLPCQDHPEGLRVYYAAGKPITNPEPYPILIEGPKGYEPVVHKLSYIGSATRDRDLGLVEQLIDPQRTVNDCENKRIEWKNLAMVPQSVTGPGGMIDVRTNAPGANFRMRGDSSQLQWVPTPQMPPSLREMREDAIADMEEIASQRSLPAQVESAKGIIARDQQDTDAQGDPLRNLADFHARLGRHLLCFAQKHYTEQRLMVVNGRLGDEHIYFKSADLRGQIDVRVLPGTIEPRTRAAVERRVMYFADKGWISPEAAMAAINGGQAESLADSYENHVARAHRVIRGIMADPNKMLSLPPREQDGQMVPAIAPRPFDNIPVHKAVFEDYFVTVDYERANPQAQLLLNLYYESLLALERQAAQRAGELQAMRAEQLGMANAAKDQGPKPLPDQPNPETIAA